MNVRENVPIKELKVYNIPKVIEIIFIEINLIQTKWL